MKTDVQKVTDEKNTVILKVEVPAADIAGSIKKAYKDVSRKVRIPGFRKGKVPPEIMDRMVGKERVLSEALNSIIPELYPKAVEMSGLDPVNQPRINVEQMEEDKPLIFTAKVQVMPEVDLGDYQSLEFKKADAKITAADVKEELERMRQKFASLEPVKKAVLKEGDYALLDYQGFIDGKPFEGGGGNDYMLEIGSETLIPGFEEQLIGAKAGEERQVKVTFPEDYQSETLAGNEAVFTVKVKEIKRKKLPPLDDEFAKNVSKFDTLAEFKKGLKKELAEKKKNKVEMETRNKVIEMVTDNAKVDIPPIMIERQIDSMVRDFDEKLKRVGQNLGSYLEQVGDDIKSFRETFRSDAEKQVKTNLVLEAVAKAEAVEIDDERAAAEIKKLAENAQRDLEEFKKELTQAHIDFLKDRLRLMETIDLLIKKIVQDGSAEKGKKTSGVASDKKNETAEKNKKKDD